MPISLSPKTTRRYSPSAIVSAVPTVGPRSEYIPPRTTANTMRRETPMPARVSGFTYVMYWAYATPPTAVRLAESIVDRKSTRLNSSHGYISYAVFCLKKKIRTGSLALVHLLHRRDHRH